MHKRHKNRQQYFDESATSCREYYIPYITQHSTIKIGTECHVLEVGCGIGGNLSVFARMGCVITGVDIHKPSIEQSIQNFKDLHLAGSFICSDIFDFHSNGQYDIIILHDTLEHIPNKERLLLHLKELLKIEGILYLGFPAWQMPFGGASADGKK